MCLRWAGLFPRLQASKRRKPKEPKARPQVGAEKSHDALYWLLVEVSLCFPFAWVANSWWVLSGCSQARQWHLRFS